MKGNWSTEVVEDYNKLCAGEIEISLFINTHWEKFIPIYKSIAKEYDDADLVINLHECFSKVLRADVIPMFLSDNQLYSYFKTALYNNILERDYYTKKIPEVSIEDLEEDIEGFEIASDEDVEGDLYAKIQMEEILEELSKRLSERQMKAVLLIYKGHYTRQEASKALGVSFWTLSDQLYRAREIVLEVLKMFR